MKPVGWVILTLVLIAGLTALIMVYGAAGVLVAVVAAVGFFFGLDRLYRWRSRRLARSMSPGETLVANGRVSDAILQETAAVLVNAAGNGYRLLVADARGAVPVQSVTPALTSHQNEYDRKSYIEFHTTEGPVHFAPRKGFLVAGQNEYAQEILDGILAGVSLPTYSQDGA
jgi:hypothetical protein